MMPTVGEPCPVVGACYWGSSSCSPWCAWPCSPPPSSSAPSTRACLLHPHAPPCGPHPAPCLLKSSFVFVESVKTQATAENDTSDFPLGPYAPWDITANHSRQLSFTTTEGAVPNNDLWSLFFVMMMTMMTMTMTTTCSGTWMNVDVSPDGQQILFDLLGDIYTLPVTVCCALARPSPFVV